MCMEVVGAAFLGLFYCLFKNPGNFTAWMLVVIVNVVLYAMLSVILRGAIERKIP